MKRFPALVAVAALVGFATWAPARAQVPDAGTLQQLGVQALGSGVSGAELLQRIQQSGLSRVELRSRLQQLGYDPARIDQYLGYLEQGRNLPPGTEAAGFVEALEQAGVAVPTTPEAAAAQATPMLPESAAVQRRQRMPRAAASDSTAEGDLPIFGRSLFTGWTTQFQPVATGPVDPDYRLGPGDELVLILTGDVELAYTLRVNREGYMVIPDVGQVFVNGLTLGELEDRLYARLGRVYSGVKRGAEATTRFQVSIGRLRTNQVYLVGEVEWPGAYQVSSVATVFNALYEAGGPTENGSFRRIQVRRGGEVVRTVDVYDYLLRGDSRDDIRLQNGDIVFVPAVGRQVTVKGAVRRPAVYELAEGDGLRDVIAYASGFDAEAFVRRVQIDRILAPEKRRPGLERVLVDVDVQELMDEDGAFIPLQDGDVVEVFAVSQERRHRVVITGEVRRPGLYEWQEGTTLWDVIERAQGLDEEAYTPRAHIFRLNEADGTRRLIRTPLLADSAARPVRDILLADRDSVVIYSRETLRNKETVTIGGFVKKPGTYTLAKGMTLKDLVLAAGGFAEGAYTLEAEVARRPPRLVRTDTTAYVLRVPLAEPAGGEEQPAGDSIAAFAYGAVTGQEPPVWAPEPEEFELRHGDHVYIRKAPGYGVAQTVMITGEVMLPGEYVLRTRKERLADLVERAGGLSGEAYAAGAQLVRGGELMGADLQRALNDPQGRDNVILEDGDSLHIPAYDPTVLVRGAVAFETRTLYEPGKGLDYYVDQAGGYADIADEDRVSVTYPNGERATVDKFLFLSFKPRIEPGSTIHIPEKPKADRGIDWEGLLSRTASIAGTLATLLIAVNQLNSAVN